MEYSFLENLLNNFKEVIDCTYKDEVYSVRDNGAIMRHPKDGKKPRKNDNRWTFGTAKDKGSYLLFCSERVHRIVATAFHGEAPGPDYVVDHIDTNRHNNRPENLRWLTKLENILNNEITRSKIEYICGSIENFLKNPSLLKDYVHEDKNFEWMRTVSKEEADATLANISYWLRTAPKSKTVNSQPSNGFGDWIYEKHKFNEDTIADGEESEIKSDTIDSSSLSAEAESKSEQNKKEMDALFRKWEDERRKKEQEEEQRRIEAERKEQEMHKKWEEEYRKPTPSLTPNCMQICLKTPNKYLCCPQTYGEYPLEDYANNLKDSKFYANNGDRDFDMVFYMLDDDKQRLWIISKVGPHYPIIEVTFKDGIFYHEYLGGDFDFPSDAEQYIVEELQGKEWKDPFEE